MNVPNKKRDIYYLSYFLSYAATYLIIFRFCLCCKVLIKTFKLINKCSVHNFKTF